MASDSAQLIAQLGGELVTYTPAGGVAKQFKAVIERRPMQTEQAASFQYGANTIEVLFPNDAVDGVTSIKERFDRIRFKRNVFDAMETDFTVNKILQNDVGLVASDGGMFHVLVQA